MWARTTRLELLIVTIGLLVLLFCSKPPQSGSAQVYDRTPQESRPESDRNDPSIPLPQSEDDTEHSPLNAQGEGSDHPQATRMGAVDARNIANLPYGDVMYGDVTVRWVWDGTRFVPQKVCIVKEKDGVSSVWSFDQQDKAVVSEISEGPGTPP